MVELACGDNKVTCRGKTVFNFTLDTLTISAEFIILEELKEDCVLGEDFLDDWKTVIDYPRRCAYIGKENRRTIYWGNQEGVEIKVLDNEVRAQIPDAMRKTLEPVFEHFADVFTRTPKLPSTLTTKHEIVLTEKKSVYKKPYPMSLDKKKIMSSKIQEMLQAGVIRPSVSRYSSPPVLVLKPDKEPRLCIDYREINSLTTDEPNILPKISDNLRELGKAKIFTLLDLKSGYWQIPMAEESKPYTAFSTHEGGCYEFNVMPFGLKGAPTTFQRLMSGEVLSGLINTCVKIYLDDILIYSNTPEEHAEHLKEVLHRLRVHGLVVSPDKCRIAKTEIEYLGHRITGHSIEPLSKHILSLTHFSAPRNKRELQSFLGTLNWVRDYVPGIAKLTEPLTRLLRKSEKFVWTNEQQTALDNIKEKFTHPLQLSRYNPDLTIILQTDGSLNGLGAVLYQEDTNGQKHILNFASTTLNSTERKYHSNELEMLAVVFALRKYKAMLDGIPFLLRTDSQAVTWMERFKETKSKLFRWSLLMQEFTFHVEHCPGNKNQLADFLSRNPSESQEDKELRIPDAPVLSTAPTSTNPFLIQTSLDTEDDVKEAPHEENDDSPQPSLQTISVSNLFAKIQAAQGRSPHIYHEKKRWLELGRKETRTPKENDIYETHEIRDGHFWKLQEDGSKLVVPRRLQPQTIRCFHDEDSCAHPGAEETLRKLALTYYWKNMRRDVQNYVRNCIVCAAQKTHERRAKAPLQPHAIQGPTAIWSIDSLGPYPVPGDKRKIIWIAVDTCTKWVEAEVYDNADTNTFIDFVKKNIVARFGPPARIIMDRGIPGISKKAGNFFRKYDIEFTPIAVEHQRANPVERKIQNFKQIMRCLMNPRKPKDWERHVPQALYNIRTRRNTATRETPAKLLYGFELALPFEWRLEKFREARAKPVRLAPKQIIERNLEFQKKMYPQDRTQREFTIGEKVLTKATLHEKQKNFSTPWQGPGVITHKKSPEVYTIRMANKEIDYHIDQIKKAPPGNPIESSDEEGESSEEYTSESDVPYRKNRYNDTSDESEDDYDPPVMDIHDQPEQPDQREIPETDQTETEVEEAPRQDLVTQVQIHSPPSGPDLEEYIMRSHHPQRGETRWRTKLRIREPTDTIEVAEVP